MTHTATRIALPRAWPAHVKSGLVNVIALAQFGMTYVRGWCANSRIARVRLAGDLDRVKTDARLLRETMRIKDARMARVPAAERPHYTPTERLEILEIRAARRWTSAETARVFLVTEATIASWTKRVDEDGPDALVALPVPVNRYPDFAAHVVQRLKTLCPAMGKTRIMQTLARAALHLSVSTVGRMLKARPARPPERTPPCDDAHAAVSSATAGRTVTARYPDHIWNLDLTVVPTSLGLWAPWWPFSIAQCWPFAWHLAAIVDHVSRAIVGFAVFAKEPTSQEMCAVLDRAVERTGRAPKYTVNDHGPQFGTEYRDWCKERGVKPRFGAIGKHGSIAVTERAIRSIKDEGIRPTTVPLALVAMCKLTSLYAYWYNACRPHASLGGAAPFEIYFGRKPAHHKPRFEPRARYPVKPGEKLRARRGAKVLLEIQYLDGQKHLPVVALKAA
jgi:transposase InsO family protein